MKLIRKIAVFEDESHKIGNRINKWAEKENLKIISVFTNRYFNLGISYMAITVLYEEQENQKEIKKINLNSPQILRRFEVEKMTGLSRSTIYMMMAGNDFPKPIGIGKRAKGWLKSDIEDWISNR